MMIGMKKKTCLESKKGHHDFPEKWSKPIKVRYSRDAGNFGDVFTDYKYIQTKTCKLCGLIFVTTALHGEAYENWDGE